MNMHNWVSRMCVYEWSAGRAFVEMQARPHLRDFLMSVFLVSIQSLSLYRWDMGLERGGCGRSEAPWSSDIEAFATAACALDVGIVEDKFTGQF